MSDKIFLSFFIAMISASVFSQQINITEPVRFLALGDSYTIGESVNPTQRWPEQLKEKLSEVFQFEELRVIAKTGWRTDQLIDAISEQDPQNYNLVSLLIGVNNQYQNRPETEMKRDFDCLLQEAISRAGNHKNRVFVLSIPDYAFTPFGQTKDAEKITKELESYNAWQKEQTLAKGITYINITAISQQGLDNPDRVAPDGLHPSGKQYGLWVNEILKAISGI